MPCKKEDRPGLDRRSFLRVSSGAALALLLGAGVTSAGAEEASPSFFETTCRPDAAAGQRILVTYASRCGSTGTIAEAMAGVLCETGATVDVSLVEHVQDLGPYQAVIVGSAIRRSRWLPEAVSFVKKHQDQLSKLPTAYFVACLTMKDDTPANHATVLAYLDPVRKDAPQITPVAIGLFPGVVDFSKVSFMHQAVLEAKGVTEGDYRNLPAVRTWATQLGPDFAAAKRQG